MSDNETDSLEIKRIDREAADWAAKKIGGLSAEEQDRFFDWLSEDSRHCDWYKKHLETWEKLDLLAQWMPEHSEKPNMDLLKYKKPSRLWAWVGGLAAALVLGIFVLNSGGNRGGTESAEVRDLVASHYESHLLPDGSTVELNKGAALKVNYTEAFRKIDLVSSEAHFHVAKDADRPFIVSVGGIEVRAIGTAFNVRLKDDSVQVLVTEGRVQLAPSERADRSRTVRLKEEGLQPATLDLTVGEKYEVSLADEEPEQEVQLVSPTEMNQLLSWKPKMFEFDSDPLEEVVRIFNQRNAVQIVLGEETLGSTPIVASFRSANMDHLLELLELSLGVRVEKRDYEYVLYPAESDL